MHVYDHVHVCTVFICTCMYVYCVYMYVYCVYMYVYCVYMYVYCVYIYVYCIYMYRPDLSTYYAEQPISLYIYGTIYLLCLVVYDTYKATPNQASPTPP